MSINLKSIFFNEKEKKKKKHVYNCIKRRNNDKHSQLILVCEFMVLIDFFYFLF